MFSNLAKDLNKVVFFTSAFFITMLTLVASMFPKWLGDLFNSIQSYIVENFGWVYILSVATILFFAIYLMLSKYSRIKLGPDHSRPEHSNLSWFAMLFSAGMGIGLMFWGVAEPVMHFLSPPILEGGTPEAAKEAMKITFFHWGLHAWAIYAVLAIVLAYFSYRKNLPLLPRSLFHPFLGNKIYGKLGDVVDTFAVIGTMFGVATSLGLGVTQVNAGLNYLFGIEQNSLIQITLIAIITGFATISVVLGLEGGIKKLSNLNVIIAILLLGSILVLGDTVYLFKSFVHNTGSYLSDVVYKSFNLYTYNKKESWIGGWTILYWAWWVAWAPFVGMFIARISSGRTVGQFMKGVLFIPAGFTFFWMTVFGNSGINLILNKGESALGEAVSLDVSTALFKFFEFFPFSSFLSFVGVLLVVTFFVSSSDSGSLVIDTLTSGGKKEPPVWQRIFWAVSEGIVAAVLLLAGGLDALQTMTIIAAFPIMVIILFGAWGMLKSLHADLVFHDTLKNHQSSVQYEAANFSWRQHLNILLSSPKLPKAKVFLEKEVLSGLRELSSEFSVKGLTSKTFANSSEASLLVKKDGYEDFIYRVHLREHETPDYMDGESRYIRAEVFLQSGGQNYDVYGFTKDQIIADAVTQYEKHLHFLHTVG